MTDTDPQTAAIYRGMLMAREPGERLLMGLRMCEAARAMVLASLPEGLSPADRQVAILRRYYQNDFSEDELTQIERALRANTATVE